MMSGLSRQYPRRLSTQESGLILWTLPEEASGYRPYREFVERSWVIGQGRRGEGELLLGPRDARPDLTAPLPPVMAFGVAVAGDDEVSVTVREILDDQMSVEIVGRKHDAVDPDAPVETRWTYSRWQPGAACPQCGGVPRVSVVAGTGGGVVTLALCVADRRIWLHDGRSGVCRPIPVTNFHNGLMLVKKIRDPKVALDTGSLFERLEEYADEDLAAAFAAYNRLHAKVDLAGAALPGARRRRGILGALLKRFLRN